MPILFVFFRLMPLNFILFIFEIEGKSWAMKLNFVTAEKFFHALSSNNFCHFIADIYFVRSERIGNFVLEKEREREKVFE